MSSQDRATIIREVSIVFHVAATVRFDEKLKLAVPINVRSTRDVLNLCKEIPNLKVFQYTKTKTKKNKMIKSRDNYLCIKRMTRLLFAQPDKFSLKNYDVSTRLIHRNLNNRVTDYY